jgi:predicted nucleic acid-binding Zn finger protein
MDEAPETPKTGNVIQPLVKNSVPTQVTQLSTFERSSLTQYDPLSTFNTKKWLDPAPMQFQHRTVKRTLVAYLAFRISVNKPSGKKGIPNVIEALRLVMDQVKILLENLQMVDPSVIFLPHKAKDRVGVESQLIATAEHVHDNYDFMRKYFPQFYFHKHDTYMYSNVIMAFNTPQEELLRESSNILYGEQHQAVYPRELQGENCVIVGSFFYSHRYMQGKRLMEFLSHLISYHMTERWKSISTIPEEGKDILRLWHVETGEKDKKQVTRFLESMYNTNHRKLFPLGYKLCFLFNVKYSIGIHGMDKAKKLFDRQADFIKIHRSVRVPGVKRAYYEDKTAGCSLTDFIMSLKSKGKSKQLFNSLDQAKVTGTCYSLSFIDIYGMETREVIHNLAAYLAHHHGSWLYKYFAAEDVELAQTCDWHE